MHVLAPLGMLGSHSCLIVPEDAFWDPNIDGIGSIFSFEPDYADLSTKMRFLGITYVRSPLDVLGSYSCFIYLKMHVGTQI